MKILVLAEHDHKTLKSSTKATLGAAKALGDDITLFVASAQSSAAISEAQKLDGVKAVIVAENDAFKHPTAENIAEALLANAEGFTHILAPATTFGKNALPRVAAKLDVAQISDVLAVLGPKKYKRPVYAGNGIATVESSDAVQVLTVRTTAFDAVKEGSSEAPQQEAKAFTLSQNAQFVKEELTKSERPDLAGARVVISGGRGLGSGDNFKMLEELADKLGAAIGASRAAVDAGYVPNDYQVGQTGKVVAPELYIAVGISGAIQHLAGMKDSKVIVAINKDEDAPIFNVADYGLVGDLFDIIPKLTEAVSKLKSAA